MIQAALYDPNLPEPQRRFFERMLEGAGLDEAVEEADAATVQTPPVDPAVSDAYTGGAFVIRPDEDSENGGVMTWEDGPVQTPSQQAAEEFARQVIGGAAPQNNPASSSAPVLSPEQIAAIQEFTPPVTGGVSPVNNPASSSAPVLTPEELAQLQMSNEARQTASIGAGPRQPVNPASSGAPVQTPLQQAQEAQRAQSAANGPAPAHDVRSSSAPVQAPQVQQLPVTGGPAPAHDTRSSSAPQLSDTDAVITTQSVPQRTQGLTSEETSKIIDSIKPEQIPSDVVKIGERGNIEQKTALANEQLRYLAKTEFTGIEGEKIRFAPKEGESWSTYIKHLIQGEATPEGTPNQHRIQALWLAEGTIAAPNVVYDQKNGNRAYVKVYADEKNMAHYIIVEVDKDNNARTLTSFIARDDKKHKSHALDSLRSNLVNKAERVIYVSGSDMLSEYPGTPAQPPASQEGTPLHRPGNETIPQSGTNDNGGDQYLADKSARGGKDEFGRTVKGLPDVGAKTGAQERGPVGAEENIRRGNEAMDRVIREHADVQDAMYREGLGDVSFLWGQDSVVRKNGRKTKPHGIAHIIKEHGVEAAKEMPNVIARGEIVTEYNPGVVDGHRVDIEHNGYEAHLALYKDGERRTWIITGYEKTPGASGEVSGSTGATLSVPNPRVNGEGAGVIDENISQPFKKLNVKSDVREQLVKAGESEQYADAGKRPGEPSAPPHADRDRPVTLRDIRESVEKLLPWRRGGTGRNLGTFTEESEVARTKYRGDIDAAAHEIGHYLDKKFGLHNPSEPAAQTELTNAGKAVAPQEYTEEQIREEGVAQFVRYYLSNDEEARADFPRFYNAFMDVLEDADPGERHDIEATKELVSAYLGQTPEERARASTVRGTDKPAGTRTQRLWENTKSGLKKFYNHFVDSQAPLARMSEELRREMGVEYLEDEHNIYAKARTAAGFKANADADAAGFLKIINDNLKPEDHDKLTDYLESARSLNYRALGMEPGLGRTAAQDQAAVDSAPEHIKKAAAELRDHYQNVVLKTLVKTGIMSQEQYDYLREKWPDYVPFFRVDTAASLDAGLHDFFKGRGKSLVSLGSPIKKAKGVANAAEVYEIRDPLEAMLRNIVVFHSLASRNEVGKTMINISKLDGMGRFAERVSEKGDNVFSVWVEGKRQYYATDPDIYSALKAAEDITSGGANLLAAPFVKAADIFRTGTTRLNPAFIVRNFLRDSMDVAINSESWLPPFAHAIKGMMIMKSANPKLQALFQEAIDQGVLRSGVTEIKANSWEALSKEIRDAFREGNPAARKLKQAAERIGSFNEMIEMAPKIYEYYYLVGKGVPKQEAAKRAREVNIDFARAGTTGRKFNRITAFFNANIQGVDKIFRTAHERPGQTAAKIVMYGVLPSLGAWALGNLFGSDDDRKEYNEINRGLKDSFWHFKVGDTWLRLPKQSTYGLVGSIAERMLDYAYSKDKGAFDGYMKSLWEAGVPPLAPTLAAAPVEAFFNYDTFTGRPIVSRKYENLPPEMQYGPSTSGASKLLGGIFKVSPIKIDHVIRGFGGTVGAEIVNAVSGGGGGREERHFSELPFIRSLSTDPYRGAESVDRFYNILEESNHDKKRYKAKLIPANKNVKFNEYLSGTSKKLSDLRALRANIQQSPKLSPEEKRERMDMIVRSLADIARRALVKYDGYVEPGVRKAGNW
jgi:hypothetical protein